MTKNILIVGVGGQGNLLFSKLLGYVLIKKGYDVKISEVHGMAQRGGSVVTYVRYGEKVYSPLIEKAESDLIIAFEKLEALRWIEYLKKDGKMIINDYEIPPISVISGAIKYPDVKSHLSNKNIDFKIIDLISIAKQLGNARIVNTIMLGFCSNFFSEIDLGLWEEVIRSNIKNNMININIEAFRKGRKLYSEVK